MKKVKFIIAGIGLIVMATACKRSGRNVIISEDGNYNYLKIEYSGRAAFNYDSTAIARITPNGYVKYKKNGQELIAESDKNGVIAYQVNGSDKHKTLAAGERVFLAQAVKDMIKHGHYNDEK